METILVFDWDGNLLDSTVKGMERMKVIARFMLGITINETHDKLMKDLWGKMGVKVFEGAFNVPKKTAEKMYAKLVEWDKCDPFKLIEGTHSALNYFLRTNRPMTILTNRTHENIQECIVTYNLEPYFKSVFGCDDCGGFEKPHKKAFDPIIEKFKISHENIIYIGDNFSDVICGRDANVRTIAVCTGFRSKKEFLDFGVKESDIILSIAELPEWYALNIVPYI